MKEPRAVFEKYLMLRLEMIPELYKMNVEHPVVLQSLEIQNQTQTTPSTKVTTLRKWWYIQETQKPNKSLMDKNNTEQQTNTVLNYRPGYETNIQEPLPAQTCQKGH